MVTSAEFETTVSELRPLLVRRASGIVQNFVDPEDIVQQALVECFANLARYDGSQASLSTWITTTVQRRIVDVIRDYDNKKRLLRSEESFSDTDEQVPDEDYNKRHKLPPGTLPVRARRKSGMFSLGDGAYGTRGEEVAEATYTPDHDLSLDLKSGLMSLPDLQREVVLAVHVEGYEVSEYAKKRGLSVMKVRWALEKGLMATREYLDEARLDLEEDVA